MLDAVVIGAGHAGLAASQRLAAAGVDHLVLERGEVGESWRSQRWDTFTLNTPNRMSVLPGGLYDGVAPDAFATRDEWVRLLEAYAARHRLPVRARTAVTALEQDASGAFVARVAGGEPVRARNVICAAGFLTVPLTPAGAAGLDARVERITAADYRSPASLPPGAVLVVGGAQSGVQIAEDLLDAGREVHLATSRVGRMPRRLRGGDSLVRLIEAGWFEQRPQDLPDPAMVRAAQPQISGVGPLGHTVSYQSLARRGATLLGRFLGAAGTRLTFGDDLAANIAFADERAALVRRQLDEHIARAGEDVPPSEPDPADEPVADPAAYVAPRELDARERGISAIVFSTGFGPDLSWLPAAARDDRGGPRHVEGRSPVAGLWFLGAVWMRKRKSGVIWGADEDSRVIVDQVLARLAAPRP